MRRLLLVRLLRQLTLLLRSACWLVRLLINDLPRRLRT